MKKILKSIMIGTLMSLLLSIPVFAGQWQHGEGNEWYYLKDNQTYAQAEWINHDGKNYFIDPNGVMMVSNYTPDGYWVGADGVWDQNVQQRNVDLYPKAAVYGWASDTDSITLSIYFYDEYYDGYSIAEVNQHLSYQIGEQFGQFFMTYKLAPVGNGCYLLMDDTGISYYLSVSEDASVMWVSSNGETTVYSFIEDLFYS